jgi:paraquat-inducible protein B
VSKKANPALIGGFVVGAVALLVVFVLAFGSGRLFRDVTKHVVFFDGSVSGLRVGASVNFRGVRLGEVTNIAVMYDMQDLDFSVPVTLEIDESRFVVVSQEVDLAKESEIRDLVQVGLRAQLAVQSFVTGLLEVQIDLFPGTEVVYRGPGPPLEIPTIPSTAQVLVERGQQFVSKLADIPFDELIAEATGAAAGLDALLNSPDTQALPADLRRSLRGFDTAVNDMREEVAGDSDLHHRISVALDEVAAAARAMRILAEYIEQHPEAVVRGR